MNFLLRLSTLFLLMVLLLTSCRASRDQASPVNGGILTPLTEAAGNEDDAQNQNESEDQRVLPLVNPGENYNILALLDVNLDLEKSDEQVIVAIPIDDLNAPLQLMIASTNPIRNEYQIVWSRPLSRRELTGVTLRAEDMTGNGRSDLIISGFDDLGHHLTEVFAVPKSGELANFTQVFSLVVDGNIDITTFERSPGYWSGVSSGRPYDLVVQKINPDSGSNMDLLETDWTWDSRSFRFRQGETRQVQVENVGEERIAAVYSGGVVPFEDYLSGAWYRESGTGSYTVMMYMDPEEREVVFFDGDIQEAFSWGLSHRTTAKRLYTRIINSVIPSIYDNLTISAEDWETLELWRTSEAWNGTYRRLGSGLQNILRIDSELKPLLSELPLAGVWKSSAGEEIVFDMPRVEWRREDDSSGRSGSASLFELDGIRVLEIRFMKRNGAFEETRNWAAAYDEDADESRIIRSLSLTPAILTANGIRLTGDPPLYFEQIEVLTASE